MIVYYMDDSILQNNEFQHKVYERLQAWMETETVDVLLISTSHKQTALFERFRQTHPDMELLTSPALFDVAGLRGNLHTTFLALEDFAPVQSYSGTFVRFDTDTKTMERIYLDLCMEYDADFGMSDACIEELEQMLSEKIAQMLKKKPTLH